MKRLFGIFSCALAVLAVSCNKDVLPVEFNLKTDKVEIPAEGGQGKIAYELENPKDGVTVSAKCEDGVDWITDFNYAVDGEISFTVAANDAEQAREAEVTVTYDTINRKFTVSQDGKAATGDDPEIKIEQQSVDVPAAGGDASVNYTIENPVQDAKVEASVTVDWITEFDTATDGKISFKVAENTATEAREATVAVKYATAEGSFVVKQAAGQSQGDLSFEINIKEITQTTVVADIIPSDKQATYISMGVATELFDQFASDEEYFQDDLDYFEYYASMYGMTLKEFLEDYMLMTDDMIDMEIPELDPSTDYYLYAYGLTSDGVRTSDIYKEKFTTEANEVVAPEFELSVTDITETEATMTVKATPASASYYFDAMEGSVSSEDILAYFQEDIDYCIEMGWCYDAADYWYGTLDTGEASFTFTGLDPNTLYTGFAFGVDEFTGEFTTEAKLIEFTTLAESGSDDEITLEIKADKYYNVNDLIELYPDDTELTKNKGKFMVPVEIVTTGSPDHVYSTYWSGDWSVESGDAIIANLSGDISGGYALEGNNVRFFMSGGHRSILAAADSLGVLVAPAAAYLGSLDASGASPASEYVPAGAPQKASAFRGRLLDNTQTKAFNLNLKVDRSK